MTKIKINNFRLLIKRTPQRENNEENSTHLETMYPKRVAKRLRSPLYESESEIESEKHSS